MTNDEALTFGTLGPSGSNHDWVTRRYIEFHGLDAARVTLHPDFDDAIEHLLRGDIHHVIQVAVHPSVAGTVARYQGRAHIVDVFISPSQPMAVLTCLDADTPSSLGLQMATRDYVDSARWRTLVAEPSTVDVAQGLLDGKYDSGLTLLKFAAQYPDRFRVEETIGPVVDAWLVYGTEPIRDGRMSVWPDSPAADIYRRRGDS